MKINGYDVVTRHERPTVLSKTALVMYFINDGNYQDPHAISGVTIFQAADNYPPSSVVGADGEITQAASANALMHFSNSATLTSDSAFDASNYNANSDASGIYKIATGQFACVWDDATTLPSGVFNLSGTQTIVNRASATGDYIDVWTVLRNDGSTSSLDTYINEFTITEDRFFGVTEPILLKVATRLTNNQMTLGSKRALKFTNEFTVENTNIDKGIMNLFKYSLVENAKILIYKDNDDRNLPARVDVSGYADTSGLIDITSENTISLVFDTNLLSTHASVSDFGSLRGTYRARLEFDVLNETYITDDIAFLIR